MNISFSDYIRYKIQNIIIKENSFDVKIANIYSSTIGKKMDELFNSKNKKKQEAIIDFVTVGLRFDYCFIRYLREEDEEKELIVNIISSSLKGYEKLKARFLGEDPPELVEQHFKNMDQELREVKEEIEIEKIANAVQTTFDPDSKEVLEKLVKLIPTETNEDYYYWKHGALKLIELYKILLENNTPFIKTNEAFPDSFRKFEVTVPKTDWDGDIRECFYLMYLLNNNTHYFDKERIDAVCFKLFNFPNAENPTKPNLSKNYDGFSSKIDNKLYLEKKFANIQKVYRDLELINVRKNA